MSRCSKSVVYTVSRLKTKWDGARNMIFRKLLYEPLTRLFPVNESVLATSCERKKLLITK